MSERKDLTRWNRAGRTHFRYVDGRAVEYLEILRQQLADKFKDPKTERCEWLNPAEKIPANEVKAETETLIQRQERLSRKQERIREMYHQDRRVWAWEIARTFARACHILTEHANAYVNEGYLGTATQWDNVRRLVEMLDYHPAPPASASTRLVLIAKENKKGIVSKGFQVKNNPTPPEAKVIFETLEDIVLDSALNELRPKGWDQSDEPAASPPDGSTPSPGQQRLFSIVAEGPAINLQGVGDTWSDQLNTLTDPEKFKIKDFLELDPKDPGIILDPADPKFKLDPNNPGAEIGEIRLNEFKARASAICNFELEEGWSDITNWLLPRIASETPESLSEQTGKSLTEVKTLQLEIALIGSYLDHEVYAQTKLKELIAPTNNGKTNYTENPPTTPTLWRAKRKPKVEAGQIAMILRESEDKAEAATVSKVDESNGDIHLLLDQVDYSWTTWPKSEIALHVSPRWKRTCWMNNEGFDVIRTVEPHGFTKGAFISWKEDENWRYAKVKKADKRTMRLEVTGSLPQKGDNLYELRPIDGSVLPADYEAIVVMADDGGVVPITDNDVEDIPPKSEQPPKPEDPLDTRPDDIFSLKKLLPPESSRTGSGGDGGGAGGGLLPPASLPKIGSFLFPSPMLPMDLVKVAVELMLSIGVMAIPSTGEIVIKGMPFGGLLEGADSEEDAANQLYVMLDKLEGIIQKCNAQGELLWILKNGNHSTYTKGVDDINDYKLDEYDELVPAPPDQATDGGENLLFKLKDGGAAVYPEPFPDDIEVGGIDDPFVRLVGGKPAPFIAPEKLVKWDDSFYDQSGNLIVEGEGGVKAALTKMLKEPNEEDKTTLFQKLKDNITEKGHLLVIPKKPPTKAIVEASEPLYMFDGKPGELENSDWVVGRFADGLRGLKIRAITDYSDEDSEKFSVSFSNLVGSEGELQKVYADFRGELVAEGATVNNTPVDPKKIELKNVPESLKVGRDVLLMSEEKAPVEAKIERIDGNTITTNPPPTGFTKGELIIRGNVVLAGHGEGKPEKILGSGNAAKTNQEFTLEVENVSFTPDPTKSSGVAAAIKVKVNGRVWEQVSTLKDSNPGDHHYAIRMTEEGYVKILFGDGEYGRRLPSGKNNIRVRYRVGSGLAGNVPAGGLEKPVNPHPLIKEVHQPLKASGGGDMEDMASLRENAPSTLLALERAVSLADFSHLAAAQSSIWQAKAFSQILHGGRMESVKVVIVPADGIQSQDIKDDIQDFLQMHAMPGVQVLVDFFKEALFSLSVTVRVKTDEFIAEEVEKAVASALVDHFTLKNRKLGQPLYLSEVYKVVEGIQGVENSICVLNKVVKDIQGEEIPICVPNDDGILQLIRVKNESERTVVYLDTDAGSTLTVTHEEYQP